jgi:hypothetical protein
MDDVAWTTTTKKWHLLSSQQKHSAATALNSSVRQLSFEEKLLKN